MPASVDLIPGLYLVATPIGNLRDISLRALDILGAVDGIICEDTRVTKKLLEAYRIEKPLQLYHDHSDEKTRRSLLEKLAAGKKLALVSDAGMPLISDPGYKLVRDCLEGGIFITTIPGPSAVPAALQLSGLPCDSYAFIGFLPPKQAARRARLEEWKAAQCTKIAYETPPRLLAALRDIHFVMGDIEMAVVREITKIYEESRRASVTRLIAHYEKAGKPKGEIVLVMDRVKAQSWSEKELLALLDESLKTLSTKDAAFYVSEKTGLPRKVLYKMALDIVKNVG